MRPLGDLRLSPCRPAGRRRAAARAGVKSDPVQPVRDAQDPADARMAGALGVEGPLLFPLFCLRFTVCVSDQVAMHRLGPSGKAFASVCGARLMRALSGRAWSLCCTHWAMARTWWARRRGNRVRCMRSAWALGAVGALGVRGAGHGGPGRLWSQPPLASARRRVVGFFQAAASNQRGARDRCPWRRAGTGHAGGSRLAVRLQHLALGCV